jgi:hypothetical protein
MPTRHHRATQYRSSSTTSFLNLPAIINTWQSGFAYPREVAETSAEAIIRMTFIKSLSPWESRRLSGGEGLESLLLAVLIFNIESRLPAKTLPVPEARPSRKREGFVLSVDVR